MRCDLRGPRLDMGRVHVIDVRAQRSAQVRLSKVVALAAVSALTVAGCSSGDDASAPQPPVSPPPPTAPPPTPPPPANPSPSDQGGSVPPPPTPQPPPGTGLRELSYGLLWSFTSQQRGLGNVSDPALLELADGTLRLFFKNGNEPQLGLTGFDNAIHSFVSSDGGETWTLEDGVRIDVNSPVSVMRLSDGQYAAWGWVPGAGGDALTRFSSSGGRDFRADDGAVIDTSECTDVTGEPVGLLGDAQVVALDSGLVAYAHDLGAGQTPPFRRPACRLVSEDGIVWEVDPAGTFAFDYDIQSNPEAYLNREGLVELWFPVDRGREKVSEVRVSTDGVSWSDPELLSWMASDPDRLDLSDGRRLLAFGGFDVRAGGLLALAEEIETPYTASRRDGLSSVEWTIRGAAPDDISARNLCRDTDERDGLEIVEEDGGVRVTYRSDGEGPGSTSCVFLLIGEDDALT